MINYRVHDLKSLIDILRNDGVEVVGGIDEYDYGKFGWIVDPEGRKIELWEPVDSGFGEAPLAWTEKVVGLGAIHLRSEDPSAVKAWYKKHLGIEDGFPYRDLVSNKEVKIEWKLVQDLDQPFVFGYRAKNIQETSTLSDPEGHKIILYPA
jgi:hypothetical protein